MGTEKTKVKGLDVFLQVMIAIFSLGWILLDVPFLLETDFGLAYYGPESMISLLSRIVFSVMVFVFVTFLFRKITATVVRVLFTFAFVLLMIEFTSYLGTLWNMLFSGYYRYYNITITAVWLADFMSMVMILLMLCFAMSRQKYSGMFIGQVICLILLVVSDTFAALFVFDEYDMEFEVICYYAAIWAFHLMLALLSIWLRRRNYYRVQEECSAFACPFMNGAFVPGVAAPVAMSALAAPVVEKAVPVAEEKVPEIKEAPAAPAAPVVPVAAVEPKQVDGIPCPVCGEICEKDALFCGTCGATLKRKTEETPTMQPKVQEYDSTPTLEPEWEEEPATQMDAYEDEPVTKIAGFEDVAIATEQVVEEEPATSILVEPVVEEEPATSILVEPVVEEPATSILVEPVQEDASAAPVVSEPKARFCRNCGTPLEEGTFFCCECGTRIEE